MRPELIASSRTTILASDSESPIESSPAQAEIWEALQQHEATVSKAIRSYLWSLLGQNAGVVRSEFDDIWASVRALALQKAHLYKPQKSANAWLCAIALNCVRELRRKKYREVVASALTRPDADADDIFDELQTARETPATVTPTFAELRASIAAHHHQVLEIYLQDGTKGQALAAHLGISEGAANVRLSRALTALRAAYRQWQQEVNHD